MENSIRFENVDKTYNKNPVIKKLNLNIKKGERIILLGASGCGKSTILRMISGLETITAGNLYLNDVLANYIDPGDRSIAMVFQNYALFPHMTVNENITFGLNVNKVPKDEIKTRLAEVLKILNLEGYGDRLPRELSGGQRQRVALARALVKRADFLLLDEPLSNLDAQLRGQARKELVHIHGIYHQTFVYVTHDQVEAMTVGQRIALINEGIVQMLDTPSNVYRHPANIFVAKFIGSPSTNIIDIKYDNGQVHFVDGQSFTLPEVWIKQIANSGVKDFKMGIRPEDITLTTAENAGPASVNVKINYVEDYGNRIGYYFMLGGQEIVSIMPEHLFSLNATAAWKINFNKLHFFDVATGKSIGDPEEI
jgi:ABC-type sugar transport system ATPase subunit